MDKPFVLVGRTVTVRSVDVQPDYFTDVHRAAIGRTGRVHAIVPTSDRANPLVKVGFDEGTRIVFYRLSELYVDADAPFEEPRKHGERASHLPKLG
jgi:hypothetical protein